VEAMVNKTVQTFGRLDILFNNAGIFGEEKGVADTSEESWDRVMQIDLKSVFLGCKYAIPAMLKTGGGVIVNTSSSAGVRPFGNSVAYCTAKAAVMMLTKTVALDYGKKGIRANALCPGITETEFYDIWPNSRQLLDEAAKAGLVGRVAKPEDMANAVLFLASEEGSFAQGAVFSVDGGITIHDGRASSPF
jgi:NAD(P)-dependent dehydrogenase (short-subunit alcohol dehydrogenase family)